MAVVSWWKTIKFRRSRILIRKTSRWCLCSLRISSCFFSIADSMFSKGRYIHLTTERIIIRRCSTVCLRNERSRTSFRIRMITVAMMKRFTYPMSWRINSEIIHQLQFLLKATVSTWFFHLERFLIRLIWVYCRHSFMTVLMSRNTDISRKVSIARICRKPRFIYAVSRMNRFGRK